MATSGAKLSPKVEVVIGAESIPVDLRTLQGRRWRDHVRHLADQLGGEPTASQGLLLRRAATLALFLEDAEADLLGGKKIDQGNYRASTDKLRALLVQLGLASKSRDVTKGDMTPEDEHAALIMGE